MKKPPQEISAVFSAVSAGRFYVSLDEKLSGGGLQLILDNIRAPG